MTDKKKQTKKRYHIICSFLIINQFVPGYIATSSTANQEGTVVLAPQMSIKVTKNHTESQLEALVLSHWWPVKKKHIFSYLLQKFLVLWAVGKKAYKHSRLWQIPKSRGVLWTPMAMCNTTCSVFTNMRLTAISCSDFITASILRLEPQIESRCFCSVCMVRRRSV